MNIPKIIKDRFQSTEHKELIGHNKALMTTVKSLMAEVQGSVDITTNTDSSVSKTYTGTPTKFNTYSKQVEGLRKLYGNTADWGCMVAKNVIDVRTAFSVGGGVKVKKSKNFEGNAEAELTWAKEFMEYNGIDKEMPQEYAKEAELEGKVLFRMLVNKNAKQVRVAHVPWQLYMYTIKTPAYDFYTFTSAKYQSGKNKGTDFNLAAPLFVFRSFGGNSYEVNLTPPKTAFIMRHMEDLDKTIWDWRKINKIFSAPTPFIKAPDKDTAKEIQSAIDSVNWRIGKMLILGGLDVNYELVGWKGDGFSTLKAECETLIKTISGTSGVPVHFLGYPELLSNRDTAENLIKLIALSTDKERHTWIAAYTELFQKSMIIYNTAFGTTLNPAAITADIKEVVLVEGGASNAPIPDSKNTSNNTDGVE